MFKHFIDDVNHHEMIDCTFYQTAQSCHAIPSFDSSNTSILSSETRFRQMRNYLNEIRCKMLTRLVKRDVTGLEFVRAFEEAPNMIENMCMSNPNIYHDKFIDQLVNMTQNSIMESPYKCMPTSKSSSGISDTSINHEFQPLPISSVSLPKSQSVSPASKTKLNSPLPSLQSLPISSAKSKTTSISRSIPSPRETIPSSRFSVPKSPPLSPHSSEDQPFSMGYQWKGEDN